MFYKSSLIICNHWNVLWFIYKRVLSENMQGCENDIWYGKAQSKHKNSYTWTYVSQDKWYMLKEFSRLIKLCLLFCFFSIVFLSLFSNHEKSCKTLQGNPILSVIYCILVFLHKLAKRNYIEKIIWRSTISTFRMKWTAHQFQFYF